MDVPFITRNLIGLCVARLCERSPGLSEWLRESRWSVKPFAVNWLRGERFRREELVNLDGLKFNLDLSDDVQRYYYFGTYETEELDLCRRLCPAGGTCLDVGANIGIYSLNFGHWVGPTGRVYAFEPDPGNFARLVENGRINDLSTIVLPQQAAVTATSGDIDFFQAGLGHSGWGSLTEPANRASERIRVTGLSLDDFLERHGIAKVSLMKVDVEGNEFAVLEGAGNSLSRQVFDHILIEWNGPLYQGTSRTVEEFVGMFAGCHYQLSPDSRQIVESHRKGERDLGSQLVNLHFSPTS